MSDNGRKFRFKVTVIGDGKVGKTSLIRRFTKGSFKKDYVKTIGAQFSVYDEILDGDKIRLLFWDIAGQDTFHFLRPNFFKNSRAAIIVYSLEDNKFGRESFDHITTWHDDITKFCGDVPVVLFGNKVDLIDEDKIDNTKIQELIDNDNFLGHYITSAETGQGVVEAFNAIIKTLYTKFKGLSDDL
ncbi:MAG: Rab family GTPase [Candidatus Thorarchaeota archaeon]